MTWIRESEYVMTKDDLTICKTFHDGKPRYTLWRGKEPAVMIGIFDTADAAMERVHEQAG